ncbi:hypothetical protein SLEP1_g40324 [Rubroshorea leprosula]|uniref:RNase H type-1 domain-containing protein n=1 Tax=Rubroshorea leprosula TaxID=152421 RepID=A0AAV5L3E7_9ROSI|nr:hypothetical protein SLEP1_g40324 [Rubroshorea leprosula]
MGFKDLHCFNLAMLARLAWRIIQNPNALWVRVLKGLYFSNSSFLNARKGSHLSWAWSTILKGREIVQLGMRLNVGNGQNILIYQDNWAPTLAGFKVTSSLGLHCLYSHVCELLDNRGERDVMKLNACFSREISREILKIPTGDCSDSIAWHNDKYGRFSVKSAYLLAYNAVHEPGINDPNRNLTNAEWKHLWKLKVPPKSSSVFMESHNKLIAFLGQSGKKGDFIGALGLDPRQLGAKCFIEWWRYINEVAKQKGIPSLVEQCAIICWHLWKARNEKYFDHVELNPHHILARISLMIQEYSAYTNKDLLTPPSRVRATGKQQPSAWSKPPLGFIKVNVDASFSPKSGSAVLAMVGRNCQGEFCFGKSGFYMALSPLMVEAATLHKATQFVEDKGVQNVIFETDNQELIACLLQPDKPSPWEVKTLILSIKRVSRSHPNFMFSFVSREGNRVADWVAWQSLKGQCPVFWENIPPNELLPLLYQDGLCN